MRQFFCFLVLFVLSQQNSFAAGCLPEFKPTPPVIDGVVASDPFHESLPNADLAWVPVPYQTFIPAGMAGTLKAAMFAGASVVGGKPDHLYLGVHVEGADQFSNQDVVTIYVDSNNDGTFDFALTGGIGLATGPVSSGNATGQDPNDFTLYHFTGTRFDTDPSPIQLGDPNVKAKTAYNFTAGKGIWELEIDINLTALGFPTSSTGLRFGAKLYTVHPGGAGSVAFTWPNSLCTSDCSYGNRFPDSGGVIAANLDTRTIGAPGACAGDVQLSNLKSYVQGPGDNYFYRPKDADFLGDGTLPSQFQTQFTADIVDVNTGNLVDTSPLGGFITPNVTFFLMPWGMGAVETIPLVPTPQPPNLTAFQTPSLATTSWPPNKAEWALHSANFDKAKSDHACLKVAVNPVPPDSDPSNNTSPQINLHYTPLSTYRDKFLIHAPGTPSPGAAKEDYLLRVHWDNLTKDQVKDEDDDDWWLRRLCYWLLPPKWCDWIFPRKPHWKTQFVNAQALGLKPAGKGYYGLRLAPGEEVVAEVELTGAAMPTPSQSVHVSPGAGGQVLSPASGEAAVEVPVPSGGMVTVVARGSIGVPLPEIPLPKQDTAVAVLVQMHNANGFAAPQLDGGKFLLASKERMPWQVTGALIGAFKPDFSDSFFIGTEGTFYATPGATKFYLAVNDVAGAYGDNTGAGFDVNVVATPPTSLPTTLSWPANPKLGLPALPPPAANLPLVAIDLFRVDQKRQALEPQGNVAYAIYATHP
jgi:hypothetical protein